MPFRPFITSLLQTPDRLFLFAPVLFGAGIGVYFALPAEPAPATVFFPVFIFLTATFFVRRYPLFYFLCLALLIFSLGIASAKLETIRMLGKTQPFENNTATYIKGIVKQTDLNAKLKPRFLLQNATDFEKPLKGFYRLTTNDKASHKIGQCLETAAVLSKPFAPMRANTYQFDRYAFFENISAVGYTLTPFYSAACAPSTSFRTKLSDSLTGLRQKINKEISKTMRKNEAAVATAVLTGDKSLISKNLQTKYRTAGLAHFLAISGLHIGLVATFVFLFVRFLLSAIPYFALKFSTYKTAAFFAILFAFAYLLLSGSPLSAERAFIMVLLVFLGIIFDRSAISMRTVALAALVILAFQPHALLSAGFQMSFAAATALVAFYESYQAKPIFQNPSVLQKTALYFFGAFLTSLVATLATLPYTIYHFSAFSPYALLSNVLAAPFIGFVIMPFLFISLLLYPFSLSFVPLKIAGFGLMVLSKLGGFVSHLPQINIDFPPLPTAFLVLVTIGGLWICLFTQKQRFFGLVFIVLGVLFCFLPQTPDAFYTSDGKTVAVALKSKKELIIFSKRKNDLTTEVLGKGFQNVKNLSRLQSFEDEDLICTQEKCTFKGVFDFDLKGNLFFEKKRIDTTSDLGGAIYLKGKNPHIKTIRNHIGYRPWNTH